MKTGIYTASKTRHAPMWRALRAEGFPVCATWIDEAGPGESACLADLWRRCVSEAAGAAALVVYAAPGDELKGALVEVGAALASGAPVFVVGDFAASWVNHANVRRAESVREAMEAALAAPEARP